MKRETKIKNIIISKIKGNEYLRFVQFSYYGNEKVKKLLSRS